MTMNEALMRTIALPFSTFGSSARRSAAASMIAVTLSLTGAASALAAKCEPPGGFDAWMDEFKRDATAVRRRVENLVALSASNTTMRDKGSARQTP